MAERRMFAKTMIDSDAFLEMPSTTQLLYFHLSMRADDEGFINKPKTIMRMLGAKDDDMNILIAKKFIIPFESGVVVIKHWRIHNYLQNDRITATKYQDEKKMLELDENKAYRKIKEECIQNTGEVYPQVSIGKVSIDKVSIDKDMVISNDRVGQNPSQNDIWFDEFWKAYPKKVQRKPSQQKFKLKVKDEYTFNKIMLDINQRKETDDWTKDNGQFIPNPTTYLNQERWNDEITVIKKKKLSFMDL